MRTEAIVWLLIAVAVILTISAALGFGA